MERHTKTIKNWKELIEFVDNEDPYTTSVVLTGFVKKVSSGTTKTHRLIFTTVPVNELEELMENDIVITNNKSEVQDDEFVDQYLEECVNPKK